jgi:hypothetical protein
MLARVLRMDTAEEILDFMNRQLIDVGLGRVVPSHHH